MLQFGPALVLTQAIEIAVGAGYLKVTRRPLKILRWIFAGNLLTVPIVWFVFPLLPISDSQMFWSSEIFAWLVESLFLWRLAGNWLSLRYAMLLSLTMNLVSVCVGLMLA